MSKTIIIDGNNLLYRTFWAANYKTQGDISSTFLFLKSLKSYADKFQPWDKIYCVWDKKLCSNTSNFRYESSNGEYKGNRDNTKFDNFNIGDITKEITKFLDTLGVFNIYPWKMEADDVISWLSKTIEGNKLIISNDKDMLQLIDNTTSIYNPLTKITFNILNFENLTNFKTPIDYFWFRCFTGDKSDNIEGIYRFGIKKYKKITIDWDYKNLSKLNLSEEDMSIVEKNKKIMDLSYGYKYYEDEVIAYRAQYLKTFKRKINFDLFLQECKLLNFDSICNNPYKWSKTFVPTNTTLLEQVGKIKEKLYNE